MPSPRASCSSSAAPERSATATTTTDAAATRSSAPTRPPLRSGSETVIQTSAAATTQAAAASPMPRDDRTLSRSTSPTGAPASAGDDARDRDPTDPSESDADERDGARLETAQQPELPALRAEPREPSPSGLEIAAHAARREDREGQQQDGSLSADEQQARTRDVRRALRLPQLFDGNVDAERRRALRELDASALRPGDELVDLPEARRARPERPHPGIGAVRAREQRSVRKGCPSLGDDERWRRGPVVLARVAELGGNRRVCDRRVAGEEEVAEELTPSAGWQCRPARGASRERPEDRRGRAA